MTKEETLAYLNENGGIDIDCAKMEYEYMRDIFDSFEDFLADRIYGLCEDSTVAHEVAQSLIEESEV